MRQNRDAARVGPWRLVGPIAERVNAGGKPVHTVGFNQVPDHLHQIRLLAFRRVAKERLNELTGHTSGAVALEHPEQLVAAPRRVLEFSRPSAGQDERAHARRRLSGHGQGDFPAYRHTSDNRVASLEMTHQIEDVGRMPFNGRSACHGSGRLYRTKAAQVWRNNLPSRHAPRHLRQPLLCIERKRMQEQHDRSGTSLEVPYRPRRKVCHFEHCLADVTIYGMSRRLLVLFLLALSISGCRLKEEEAATSAIPPPPDVAAPPADAIKTPSGLASKVLQIGFSNVRPSLQSTVRVHYTGWTTDGKMFDSSVARGEPAEFPVTGVIPGWTEGLQLMVVGEKRRFWIPGALAYGASPDPSTPKGTLVFDVELIAVK